MKAIGVSHFDDQHKTQESAHSNPLLKQVAVMSPDQRHIEDESVISEQLKGKMRRHEAKENPLDNQQRYETLLASLDDGKAPVLNSLRVNSLLAKGN